jgi:hypothetical protein
MSVTQIQQITTGQPDGAKIGAAATDKLGFYGATPVVQQTTNVAATDLATATVAIAAIKTALTNLGLTN